MMKGNSDQPDIRTRMATWTSLMTLSVSQSQPQPLDSGKLQITIVTHLHYSQMMETTSSQFTSVYIAYLYHCKNTNRQTCKATAELEETGLWYHLHVLPGSFPHDRIPFLADSWHQMCRIAQSCPGLAQFTWGAYLSQNFDDKLQPPTESFFSTLLCGYRNYNGWTYFRTFIIMSMEENDLSITSKKTSANMNLVFKSSI